MDGKMSVSYSRLDSYSELNGAINLHAPTTQERQDGGQSDVIRSLNARLLNSVENNQPEAIQRLLQEGASPNAMCVKSHVTAVHVASMEGRLDILEMLLAEGAEPLLHDLGGRTPLHLATRFGHVTCVRALLSKRAALLNRRLEAGSGEGTDVMWMDGHLHDHDRLLRRLPRLTNGATALHVASQFGYVQCVEVLLEAGADVSIADLGGLTPLDVVGEHLDDVIDEDGAGDLTARSLLSLVVTLVDAGGVPGRSDGDPRHTPLHAAVRMRCTDAIPSLKDAGYTSLMWDRTRSYPVHLAVHGQMLTELQVLLSVFGCEAAGLFDGNGFTPLHLAVLGGWREGVECLLNTGADVTTSTAEDCREHESETVLHLAARGAHVQILEKLLKSPRISEVMDEVNSEGQPPLFHAVMGGNLACVTLLLDARADVTVKDRKQRTVLHWATDLCHPNIVTALFRERFSEMARMRDFPCDWGFQATALHIAAYTGDARVVEVLIQQGCDPRVTTTFFQRAGCTPLHLAAHYDKLEVIRRLLNFDPTLVTTRAADGCQPIHLACQYRLQECVRVLIEAGSDLSAECRSKDGTLRTAFDLLMSQVRSPVDLLQKIFDSMITCTQPLDTYVNINYKALLPDAHNCREVPIYSTQPGDADCQPNHKPQTNQMKVIEALLKSGNQQKQQSLLMHPLVESFLYLQWKSLSVFYYGLIVIYAIFIHAFTAIVLNSLKSKDQNVTSRGESTFLRVLVAITLLLLLFHELVLLLQTRLKYFTHFESWLKIGCYCLTLAVTVDENTQTLPLEVTSAAILSAWIEFMFLISRVPRFGYCVLMFSTVAKNLFRVLWTFAALIIGFAIAFMVQFQPNSPFDSKFESLVKTIVMMTGEFDYSGLEFNDNGSSATFGKIIFILFVILVNIVLMNLLVAMAVTDIKDLDTQGKINRLYKEAEFVSLFEKIIFDNILMSWLKSRKGWCMKHRQTPAVVQLSLANETRDGVVFPAKLRRTVLDLAMTNREIVANKWLTFGKLGKKEQRRMRKEKTISEMLQQISDLKLAFEAKNNLTGQKFDEISKTISEINLKLNLTQSDGTSFA